MREIVKYWKTFEVNPKQIPATLLDVKPIKLFWIHLFSHYYLERILLTIFFMFISELRISGLSWSRATLEVTSTVDEAEEGSFNFVAMVSVTFCGCSFLSATWKWKIWIFRWLKKIRAKKAYNYLINIRSTNFCPLLSVEQWSGVRWLSSTIVLSVDLQGTNDAIQFPSVTIPRGWRHPSEPALWLVRLQRHFSLVHLWRHLSELALW